MIVLIVCLVLIAVALVALGGFVVGLLNRIRAFGREVSRAQVTMGYVEAVLAELPRRPPADSTGPES